MALADSDKRLKRTPDNDRAKMKAKADRVLFADVKQSDIDILFNTTRTVPGFKVTINLEDQHIETQDKKKFIFKIDINLKNRLLEGLDDIAITLEHSDAIKIYENSDKKIILRYYFDIFI